MATLEQQLKDLKGRIEANKVEKMVQIKYLKGPYANTDFLDIVRADRAARLVKAGKAEIVKPEKKEDE